jgi:N-acyl-D-aspartate/D-glutamate deacylase
VLVHRHVPPIQMVEDPEVHGARQRIPRARGKESGDEKVVPLPDHRAVHPGRIEEERFMAYDLLIKNGWVVDGSGRPRYRADVGVSGGRIAAIGRIRESAREVLDAEGQVVSPGFVDGHTHMDAQVFWDPLGTCSCWHGITTVVMGNCGFTLAPCAKEDRHLVIRNLQRAEDISLEAMEAGIEWTWKTFAEFLDTVDGLPKGINYSGYMGHSALRTYVMGERAFEEAASEYDLRSMEAELRSGLRAGAVGFTTSRSPSHETPDRRPVASRLASWDEVRRLVGVMGDMNAGIFELAGEGVDRDPNNPGLADYHRRLRELAVETGRPITFGLFSRRDAPEAYKAYVKLLEDTAAQGGRMTAQVHSRALSAVLSFKTQLPFDRLPVWNELRALPLEEQKRRLRDPELRGKLVLAARERMERKAIGTEARPAVYEWIHVMETVHGPHRSVAEIAQARGVDPVEAMIDLGLETDFDVFFLQPIANENQEIALELIKNPRTVVTFSDSGAHVSQLMDASLQTHLLAHWVRAKQALTLEEAVRMLTFDTATMWGFSDRGLVREGMAADLVVFDPDIIAAEMPEVVTDLPAGARRLIQRCRGVAATVVNGDVLLRDGKHTGALPGKLLRGPLARAGA